MTSKSSRQRYWPVVVKYAEAVLFAAAAAVVTNVLRDLCPSIPNSLFFCAVILSAWFGGWGPGMLASILSFLAIVYLLPPPSIARHGLYGTGTSGVVFFLVSLFINWICTLQRRLQTALWQARGELEQRVSERTRELVAVNDGLKTEIGERKRTEALLNAQKRVLEMLATGTPLTESLATLVRLIEEQSPGMLGSILLLDKLKHHFYLGVAPSLPREYIEAIYGLPIGPTAGSCGTAAYRKEPVVVKDIATDPLWKDYREIALPHGLRASWSMPIVSAQQELLGTFAMYYRQPALPEAGHWHLVELATHIASIAISSDRSQSALRESEAKLKEAQRIGKLGYWERDIINDVLTWPEETRHIFGLPPDYGPINQEKLQQLVHPDDRRLQRQTLKNTAEKGDPYDVEYRIVRPDGNVRYIHVRAKIVRDGSGRPIRLFGTVQDITERKRAEKVLQESQQLLQLVLATLPVGVTVINQDREVLLTNAAARRIWGELVLAGREQWTKGKGFWHDTGSQVAPSEWASVRALTRGETNVNEVIDIESFDGQQKIILNSSAPIHNTDGRITGAVIVNEDVTERKRSEEKLRQTEEELARAARLTMMGALTASIAHEVNQPLAAVVSNANAGLRWLAISPPNLDETSQALQRIVRDGTRASEVIQRVRDLIKKSVPTRKLINLNALVQETVALAQAELRRKRVSLRTDLATNLPLVLADFVQVQQVLLNLVVNAIDSLNAVKERPRWLRISTSREEPDAVQLTVQDTGVGINPQDMDRLFEPFYTTKSEGLGMGLAISRTIVEALGGRLWAAPSQGPGAIFQFSLPVHDGERS